MLPLPGAALLRCAVVGVAMMWWAVNARPAKREDFSQYLANDSLIGVAVPCTEAEKECLRFNRLWHRKSGRCYPLGHGPRDCRFFVDRREYVQGEGHVRGVCLPREACEGGDFLLAYDGRCVGFHDMIKICSRSRDLEPASHFFGGTECVKAEFSAPAPLYTKQPEARGECVIPNFRFDFTSVRAVEAKLLGLRCSSEQGACFSEGLVWYEPLGACFPLLERGPCSENHHLVLKKMKSKDAAVTCAPVNPCKSHERPMAFDGGQCHEAAVIRMVLCPTGVLLFNAFGHMSCSGVKDMYRHVIALHSARPGMCEVEHRVSHALEGPPGKKVAPDCSLTDAGSCSRAVDDLMSPRTVYGRSRFNEVMH